MDLKTSLLNEIKHEATITRRMLELVPFDKATWKPHEKSMEMQKLAKHIASIPTWVSRIVTTNEMDFAKGRPSPVADLKNTADLLALFDANTAQAVKDVEATTSEALMQTWTMRDGEKVFYSHPRVAIIRNMAQNHNVHHRGQLSVYLRLSGVLLPSVYGSTADVTM